MTLKKGTKDEEQAKGKKIGISMLSMLCFNDSSTKARNS